MTKKKTTRKKGTGAKASAYKLEIEPSFKKSGDPAQLKLLTKVQAYLRDGRSRHSVVPSLCTPVELRRLKNLVDEYKGQTALLEKAVAMIEKSPAHKKAAKSEGVMFT